MSTLPPWKNSCDIRGANVSLQISRDSFVCGKVIQMHTIHESNCTVTKLPHNRNTKMKRKLTVYRSYQAQLMGWMHLMIFIQMIHL